jgi:hypothetical protein
MQNRKWEGECGMEKPNATEDEFRTENRNATLKSLGEFRQRKVATTRNSEPKIRVDFADVAALNELGNKSVPGLGPRGNLPEKPGPRGNLPENSDTKGSADLQCMSKDLQERKATKMWEEHLIEDGAREWTKKERSELRPACDTLRRPILIWWKGKVSSLFRAWLNGKYIDTFEIINKNGVRG